MRKTLVLSLLLAPWAWAQDPCAAPAVATAVAQARTLLDQRKYAEAQAPARQALAMCPTHADANWALGKALVASSQNDAAIAEMSAALVKKADLPAPYLWRGYAYYNKKQPDKMVGDFETFLRLAPSAPEAAAVRQLLAGIKR